MNDAEELGREGKGKRKEKRGAKEGPIQKGDINKKELIPKPKKRIIKLK